MSTAKREIERQMTNKIFDIVFTVYVEANTLEEAVSIAKARVMTNECLTEATEVEVD